MSTGKRGSRNWIPGTSEEPTSLEVTYLTHLISNLEKNTKTLVIHLREITNNERYQHHKLILKARRREITVIRQTLELIDEELQEAMNPDEVDHGR